MTVVSVQQFGTVGVQATGTRRLQLCLFGGTVPCDIVQSGSQLSHLPRSK